MGATAAAVGAQRVIQHQRQERAVRRIRHEPAAVTVRVRHTPRVHALHCARKHHHPGRRRFRRRKMEKYKKKNTGERGAQRQDMIVMIDTRKAFRRHSVHGIAFPACYSLNQMIHFLVLLRFFVLPFPSSSCCSWQRNLRTWCDGLVQRRLNHRGR